MSPSSHTQTHMKNFFQQKLETIRNRIKVLEYWLEKSLNNRETQKALNIQKEIDVTKRNLKRAEIESIFHPVEQK